MNMVRMDIIFSIVVLLSLQRIGHARSIIDSTNVFSVDAYGAVGDGKTDDSQAFLKAWKDACGSKDGVPTLSIPSGKTFLLKPISFSGPCQAAGIHVQILGTIQAPQQSEWSGLDPDKWIMFREISGLNLEGPGTIDGSGSQWWPKSCKRSPKACIQAPTQLVMGGCSHLQMSHLKLVNSPRNHLSIGSCDNVVMNDLTITAPGDSPNTDGIDISNSKSIVLSNSIIATGDDCVAINSGTSDLNITGVACGPGHGISIGSLGGHQSYSTVERVRVENCNFTGTTNGARIKTWQGGSGHASSISFLNINLNSVRNPIIIDQYYCDRAGVCPAQKSAVQVSDVKFKGIHGTSETVIAINLNCSETVACTGITMDDIKITSANPRKDVSASCVNAHGSTCPSCTPKVTCLAT